LRSSRRPGSPRSSRWWLPSAAWATSSRQCWWLALAAAIYWLIGRNPATIVTAGEAAATIAILFVLCALADLATGYPYQAVLFLLAAGALGFAFLLLQQGTIPVELRFGGVAVVARPDGLIHLRMLEELRDAGILSADEFAAKRLLVEPRRGGA
jgi:hypothetical protein